jgi:hypothetical protein
MTREILIQYCDLKQEVQKLEKRIDRLEKQSEMVSDVVQNGYKRHAVIYGYDYNRTFKLNMLKHILKERYNAVLELQIQIEEYISKIPKSDIRQIFEHYYIDNMNWIQIMHAMNYKSESTARMKHDRFLEKNYKCAFGAF